MSNSTVLREYLLSLGFRVNSTETKNFTNVIGRVEKGALAAGGALVALGTAAIASTRQYASGVEKLLYASQRTSSTVKDLQAVRYAAEQIGLSADETSAAIEAIADIRIKDPGVKGYEESLGIDTALGGAKSLLDIVKKLQGFAPFIRYQIGESFGIPSAMFRQLENNMAGFEKAFASRIAELERLGDQAGKNAEAFKEWNNEIKSVMASFEDLQGSLAVKLLPTLREMTTVVKEFMDELSHADSVTGFLNGVDQLIFGSTLGDDWNSIKGKFQDLKKWARGIRTDVREFKKGMHGPEEAEFGKAVPDDEQGRLSRLEKLYALPSGLLDAIYKQESGRGQNVYNKKSGAAGPFQFMPRTAKEYGIEGQEYDFDASSEAAARKLKNLLRWSGGDLATAVAGYNRGEGNFADIDGGRLGNSPLETRNYVKGVLGTMQQHNTFIINGGEAKAIGDEVAGRMANLNNIAVRDIGGGPR